MRSKARLDRAASARSARSRRSVTWRPRRLGQGTGSGSPVIWRGPHSIPGGSPVPTLPRKKVSGIQKRTQGRGVQQRARRESGPRVPSAGAHSPRARTPRRRRHARAARTEGPGCRHVPACALEGPGQPRGAPRGLPGPAPIPDPLPAPRYQNPGPPRSLRTHSRPPCQQEPFSPHYSRDFLCYRRLI